MYMCFFFSLRRIEWSLNGAFECSVSYRKCQSVSQRSPRVLEMPLARLRDIVPTVLLDDLIAGNGSSQVCHGLRMCAKDTLSANTR